MRHSHSLIGFIEDAIDQDPFCACGAGMTVVEHDGAMWIECVRHDDETRGLVSRIWSLFGHDRRLLLAADEAA
jgi:hypothetical protein